MDAGWTFWEATDELCAGFGLGVVVFRPGSVVIRSFWAERAEEVNQLDRYGLLCFVKGSHPY